MSETEEIIFGFLLFVVSLSIILIPLFISLRSSKKARTQPPAKPEKLKLSVTVMDMRCGVKMVGIKTPKTVREFWVTFQTEDGRILELPVREGMYHGFDEGQTGTLILKDGQVYSFILKKQAASADNA